MKTKTIPLFVFGLMIASTITAQSNPAKLPAPHPKATVTEASATPSTETLSGNVALNLKIYKKGKIEESIAFLTLNKETTFAVEHIKANTDPIQPLKFMGAIKPIENKTYQIEYTFSQSIAITTSNRTEYRNSGWQSVVEIKKGSEVVLMKNGEKTYTLELSDNLNKSE